jgi:putative transport protein
VLGIFSGASTNTPSLGAGTQTLGTVQGIAPDRLALPALAYAVTYPTAIVGIIATLLVLKRLFRVNIERESEELAAKTRSRGRAARRGGRSSLPTRSGCVALGAFPAGSRTGVTSRACVTTGKRTPPPM